MGQCCSHPSADDACRKSTTAQRIAKVAAPVVPCPESTAAPPAAPISVTLKSGGGLAVNIGEHRQLPSHQVAAVCAALRSNHTSLAGRERTSRSSLCSAPRPQPGVVPPQPPASKTPPHSAKTAPSTPSTAASKAADAATATSSAGAAAAAAKGGSDAPASADAAVSDVASPKDALAELIPRSGGFSGGDLQPRLLRLQVPGDEEGEEVAASGFAEEEDEPAVVDIREVSRFDRTPRTPEEEAGGKEGEGARVKLGGRSGRSRVGSGGSGLAPAAAATAEEGQDGHEEEPAEAEEVFETAEDMDVYLQSAARGRASVGAGERELESRDSYGEGGPRFRTPCQSFNRDGRDAAAADEDEDADTDACQGRQQHLDAPLLAGGRSAKGLELNAEAASGRVPVEAEGSRGHRSSEGSGRWSSPLSRLGAADARGGPQRPAYPQRSASGLRWTDSDICPTAAAAAVAAAAAAAPTAPSYSPTSRTASVLPVLPRPGSANQLLRRATANRVKAAAAAGAALSPSAAAAGGAGGGARSGTCSPAGSTHGSVVSASHVDLQTCSSRDSDSGRTSGGMWSSLSTWMGGSEASGGGEEEETVEGGGATGIVIGVAKSGSSSKRISTDQLHRNPVAIEDSLLEEDIYEDDGESEDEEFHSCSEHTGTGSNSAASRSDSGSRVESGRSRTAAALSRLREEAAARNAAATAATAAASKVTLDYRPEQPLRRHKTAIISEGRLTKPSSANSTAAVSAAGTEASCATASSGGQSRASQHRISFANAAGGEGTTGGGAQVAPGVCAPGPAAAFLRQKAVSERCISPLQQPGAGGGGAAWSQEPPQCLPHGVPARFPDHLLQPHLRAQQGQQQQGQQQQQEQQQQPRTFSGQQGSVIPVAGASQDANMAWGKPRQSAEVICADDSDYVLILNREKGAAAAAQLPPRPPRVPQASQPATTSSATTRRKTVNGQQHDPDSVDRRQEDLPEAYRVGSGSVGGCAGLRSSPLWLYPSGMSAKTLDLFAVAPSQVRSSSLSGTTAPPELLTPPMSVSVHADMPAKLTDPWVTGMAAPPQPTTASSATAAAMAPYGTTATKAATVSGGEAHAAGSISSASSEPARNTLSFRQRWSDTNVPSTTAAGMAAAAGKAAGRPYRGSDTNGMAGCRAAAASRLTGALRLTVGQGAGEVPSLSYGTGFGINGNEIGAMPPPTPPGAISDRTVMEAWGAKQQQQPQPALAVAQPEKQQQQQQQPKSPVTPQLQMQHPSNTHNSRTQAPAAANRPFVQWLHEQLPPPSPPPPPQQPTGPAQPAPASAHRPSCSQLSTTPACNTLFHNHLYDDDNERNSGGSGGGLDELYDSSRRLNAVFEEAEAEVAGDEGEERGSRNSAVRTIATTASRPVTLSQRRRLRSRDDSDDGGAGQQQQPVTRLPPPPPPPAADSRASMFADGRLSDPTGGLRGEERRKQRREEQQQQQQRGAEEEAPGQHTGGGCGSNSGQKQAAAPAVAAIAVRSWGRRLGPAPPSGDDVSSAAREGAASAPAKTSEASVAAAAKEPKRAQEEMLSRVARLSPLLAAVLAAED